MKQLEIDFFWPLTEQIPLDLDYSDCNMPKLYTTLPISGTGFVISDGNGGITTTSSYLSASKLIVDVASTTFKVDKEPNIIRKGLLNILGIKWEKK